jgi:hypothetical protein
VCTGSDSGEVFVWETASGELMNRLAGDRLVVNGGVCVCDVVLVTCFLDLLFYNFNQSFIVICCCSCSSSISSHLGCVWNRHRCQNIRIQVSNNKYCLFANVIEKMLFLTNCVSEVVLVKVKLIH